MPLFCSLSWPFMSLIASEIFTFGVPIPQIILYKYKFALEMFLIIIIYTHKIFTFYIIMCILCTWTLCDAVPQSSEPLKELYTQLMEKMEAQKKSPPPSEETPSLDLGLHPVTVPTTASTPAMPLWGMKKPCQCLTVHIPTSPWIFKETTFYILVYCIFFSWDCLSWGSTANV